jgi:hypothetical protein
LIPERMDNLKMGKCANWKRRKGRGEIQMQSVGTGQTLLTHSVNNLEQPTRVETSKLSPGLYILKVNSAEGIKAIIVMKE